MNLDNLKTPPTLNGLNTSTSAELRAYLGSRGATYKRSSRKADLLALALDARSLHVEAYATAARDLMVFAMGGSVPKPDLRATWEHHVEGWDYNAYSRRVFWAWSESHAHGSGSYTTDWRRRHARKGRRDLYSSKEAATLAMAAGAMCSAVRKGSDAIMRGCE